MKQFSIHGLLIAVLCSSGPAVFACESTDFKDLFRELRNITTISEAIELRRSFLDRTCNLEDLDRLTDLEAPSENAHFYPAYRQRLARFFLEEMGSYTYGPRFVEIRNLFSEHLVKKMTNERQSILLRRKLLPTLRTCNDLYDLTNLWNGEGRRLKWDLERFRAHHYHLYCD